MTSMTAERLGANAGAVRRAVVDGDEVTLTFHGKPYARVVPHDLIEQERAELDRLRRLAAAHGLIDHDGEVPAVME